jgi:pimeloyl-ACP methyl ester carboxylesterase
MSRFVLIPGSGGAGWYWSQVVPLLDAAGHHATAVTLPADDTSAGLAEYADLVVAAAGSSPVIVVAASLGGFTAPLVCPRLEVDALVFVNAMIPLPGETAGDWWGHVGAVDARVEAAEAGGYSPEFDLMTYFLHDVPPELAAEGESHQRDEADIVFTQPCQFTDWPPVPTRVLAGADDRFFPLSLQQRVARERLGREVDVVPGGHLVALANPTGVSAYLTGVADSLSG